MIKVAILAAVECRIHDLSKFLKEHEVQRHWKLIFNSIPETLHIEEYLFIVPKPERNQGTSNIEIKDSDSLFFDTIESIVDWSLWRCYQIIRNTLDLKLVLSFLTSIITHLGFNINSDCTTLTNSLDFCSEQFKSSVILLFSLHSILVQYSISQKFYTKYNETTDILSFIFSSPYKRWKYVIDCCIGRSETEIENVLLEYFKSYIIINSIKFTLQKKGSKMQYNQYFNEECQPFINLCDIGNNLQIKSVYNCQNLALSNGTDIIDQVRLNLKFSFEDIVTKYFCNEISDLPIEFFCILSKVIIVNSNPIKKYYERIISCPLKTLQIIIISINGVSSPLLNSNALEIQNFIDKIYECIPNNKVLIKQINKPLIIHDKVIYNELQARNESFIFCPFCKKLSIQYNGNESSEKYRSWLRNIYTSIEFHERQQLIVDLLIEFPLKFIKNIRLFELTRLMHSPELLECFLIRIVKKVPETYTFGIIKNLSSLYELLTTTNKLPSSPFGNLTKFLIYILETIIYEKPIVTITDNIFVDIISSLFSASVNAFTFIKEIIGVLNNILENHSILNVEYFDSFIVKLNFFIEEISLENKLKFKNLVNSIQNSITISRSIQDLSNTSPLISDLDPIFSSIFEEKLDELNSIRIYNSTIVYEPKLILDKNSMDIFSNLLISNPSLCLVGKHSSIYSKLSYVLSLLKDNITEITLIDMVAIKAKTLLIYNYEEFAIKLLLENVQDCKSDELYCITLNTLLEHNKCCKNCCSDILHSHLCKLEEMIIKNFPFKFLEKYIVYKAIPAIDMIYDINTNKILENLRNSFKFLYYCSNSNVKSFSELYNNSFFLYNHTVTNKDIYFFTTNLSDVLIFASTDLLTSSCRITMEIFSSVNVNVMVKLQICESMIAMFSRKELKPSYREIAGLFTKIYNIFHSYIVLLNTIYSNKTISSSEIKEILLEELKLPAYLLPFNSHRWIKRWKIFMRAAHLNIIASLIYNIDGFISGDHNHIPLSVSFELFKLFEMPQTVPNKCIYPILSSQHINIIHKYPEHSVSILGEYYKPSNSLKNMDGIFIRLLLIIISIPVSNSKNILKFNFFKEFGNINLFRLMTLIFRIFPSISFIHFSNFSKKLKISIIKEIVSFLDVWDNYWSIRRIFLSCLDRNSLSVLSLCILENAFFSEKRFSQEKYRRLVTKEGRSISQILFDLLYNASHDYDGTLNFVIKFSSNKTYQVDITTLLCKILTEERDRWCDPEAKKLLHSLNIINLNIKLSDHFETFKGDLTLVSGLNSTLFFCLDGLLNLEIHKLSELLKIIHSSGCDCYDIFHDSIILKISTIDVINDSGIFELNDFIEKLFIRCILVLKDESFAEFYPLELLSKISSSIFQSSGNAKGQIVSRVIFNHLKKHNVMNNDLVKNYLLTISKSIADIINIKSSVDINMEMLEPLVNEIKVAIVSLPFIKTNSEYFVIHDVLCEIVSLKTIIDTFNGTNTRTQNFDILSNTGSHVSRSNKIVSELTFHIFRKLLLGDTAFSFKLLSWFIFGTFLLDNVHVNRIFESLLQKKMFNISIISSSRKYVLKSVTNIRIEEVLLSKSFHHLHKESVSELVSLIILTLNGCAFMLAGTSIFSRIIIPLLALTNTEIKTDFIRSGEYICNKLKIPIFPNIDLSLIGIFFNILIIFRSQILELLILQLLATKSYGLAMKIISLDLKIIDGSISSQRYALKIISKYLCNSFISNNDNFCKIYGEQNLKIVHDINLLVLKNKISMVKCDRNYTLLECYLPKYVFYQLLFQYLKLFPTHKEKFEVLNSFKNSACLTLKRQIHSNYNLLLV